MALVVFSFFGLVVGGFVVMFWASADALLGTSTLTEARAVGSLGMSVVLANAICWGVVVWSEFQ